MRSLTHEEVLTDLVGMLSDFQGRQYSGDIAAETLFFGDLGFVSIDAIVLAEALEHKYQQRFPFEKFLESVRAREAIDIQVGELAEFVHQHLHHAGI